MQMPNGADAMSMRVTVIFNSVWHEIVAAAKAAPAIYFAPLVGAVKEVRSLAKGK